MMIIIIIILNKPIVLSNLDQKTKMLLKLYRSSLVPVLVAYNNIEFAQAVPIDHHLLKFQDNAPAPLTEWQLI